MGVPDDLPVFRPRFGKRQRASERAASGSLRVAVLVRLGHGRFGGARRPGKALAPAYAPAHRADARRVVVKAHVQRLTVQGAKAAALHLRYIERDGVEKDGSSGVLYGPEGPVPRERFEQPRLGEKHQFRFIVSPEDGGELDLTAYVRRLMGRLERDLGRPVEWAAVNHHDTGHPHAHVVVRGVDLEGAPLRMSRTYIARGLRWTAQELATELLGPRLESEVHRSRVREVTQERFTSLDRDLERCVTEGRVDLGSVHRVRAPDAPLLVGRLEQLEQLGVAERVSSSAWVLAEGWQGELRARGARGDILKQMHQAVAGDASRYHVVGRGKPLPDDEDRAEARVRVGRVARKGLVDEAKGTFYAVLETPTGHAYHVPLSARAVDTLRAGDLVSFATPREPAVTAVDRHIADVAHGHGGVYALAGAAGGEGAPARIVAARLRELERQGRITPQAPGRWIVPADLLEQLESKASGEPARHRLWIEPQPLSLDAQVRHRGPVWLDSVEPTSLAGWGFGAQVHGAVRRRHDVLRELGIAPDDPHRQAKLEQLELRTVAQDLARQTGQRFLASVPNSFRFRGRVLSGPEGARYLAVSDGECFVLVPATREALALAGQEVQLVRDDQGRLRGLRPAPDRGRDF